MKILLLARNGTLLVITLTAILTLASCNNQQRKEQTEGRTEVVKIETATPGDSTKNFTVYTYEQKDEAVREANSELDKLNRQIDELKADANARSAELSAEVKADYQKAITDLEKTRDDYKAEIEKLQNSTQENWEQTKRDISSKYENAKRGVERGWKNFKEDVNRSVEEVEKSLR
ncbi:hypothetical protein [uncultured Proteiniphilum sp.]|uniref:hypothetical protein n=1 Tax=uncultured Proteiniphilum sp. TaxID=497637 RepID=UPI00260382AD|nr:hypothetical protein [uncultured Proteiniphilum sp.]